MKYSSEAEFEMVKKTIMTKIGVSNDNQLAISLGYTSNSAIAEWNKKLTIPEKILRKYYENTKTDIKKSSSLVTINLYEDIHASAGYGTYNNDIEPKPMQFDKAFLQQFFNITSFLNLDIIRVVGDSMIPYINDGEYVLVQREIQPKNGDTVIANFDGELYIKRYKKLSPFEHWFKLESSNKEYPDINIDTQHRLETCNIVGIVKSKIKIY